MTHTVLVVDDSPVDQRLIGGLLRSRSSFRIDFADHGRAALERIATAPPELVVTDLLMPELNGLELVHAIRQRHPDIPVIVMTAYGNEETALEAMRAGAVCYVPKSQQAERLLSTANRVMSRQFADRYRRHTGGRLHKSSCSYTINNDPASVASLVDQIQFTLVSLRLGDTIDRIRICLALEEALLNAIYHGNPSFEEKVGVENLVDGDPASVWSMHEQPADYEIGGHSSAALRDDEREVSLDADITVKSARFVVRDDGCGFDHSTACSRRLDQYFERGDARGLMLMHVLMDDVRFNASGNEVTLVKNNP